jgi:glutamate-1-semialdehyde 2,1-aminomutase
MTRSESDRILAASRQLFPGGVNSPVRAFRSVGTEPVVIQSASGATVRDADGNDYIDYIGSWGPMILGHAHPEVVAAVQAAAARGTSFGAPTEAELRLGELVRRLVPAAERLRFVNSGTEATMHALRLARGATGREMILKFDGCYHGASDSLLVRAGSGVATLALPGSPGVPADLAAKTAVVPFNDLPAVQAALAEHRGEVAAIIVEPVMGNMGVVPPAPGFLERLRAFCDDEGAVLIFDEVMTGFRIARGGAVQRFGVTPDLVTFGKVIGGGLPVGAFGGRAELMRHLAPEGEVYQAGTLSGNPLAMAAGLATLGLLQEKKAYERLEALSARLADGLQQAASRAGLRLTFNRVGSMQSVFFTDQPVTDAAGARSCDTERFGRFFRAMLERGVMLAPSQFEAAFLSLAHTEEQVDRTVAAAEEAFALAAES